MLHREGFHSPALAMAEDFQSSIPIRWLNLSSLQGLLIHLLSSWISAGTTWQSCPDFGVCLLSAKAEMLSWPCSRRLVPLEKSSHEKHGSSSCAGDTKAPQESWGNVAWGLA